MNLILQNRKITIIGVYAVNNDAPMQKKEQFYENLSSQITKIGNSKEIILLEDFNGRTGKKRKDNVVGQFGEDTTNDNGNRLISIAEQHELKILNGFIQHPWIHKYTWTQNMRGLKLIIDYILIRQKTDLKVQDVRVHRGPTGGSDHYWLGSKILFPWR